MKILKAIKGGRRPITSRTEKELKTLIRNEADKYNCSMSFVVNTVLNEYFNIKHKGEKYYDD
jgi:hypothetical protein